jgi:cation transport protein ChaC
LELLVYYFDKRDVLAPGVVNLQHLAVLWVFGYGSLMWRPGFDHEQRRAGYVVGYRRRFWQGSTDHRGVPDAPGRVVTMLPQQGERCWGIAYQVAAAQEQQVLAQLDHREKGGYARVTEAVHDAAGEPFAEALVYIATPDNPNYLGCAPLPDIARQVVHAEGPSGRNDDYVLRLAQALRDIGADDNHVFRLEAMVRAATSDAN